MTVRISKSIALYHLNEERKLIFFNVDDYYYYIVQFKNVRICIEKNHEMIRYS